MVTARYNYLRLVVVPRQTTTKHKKKERKKKRIKRKRQNTNAEKDWAKPKAALRSSIKNKRARRDNIFNTSLEKKKEERK